MNMENFAGQQALISSRLKDIIDEIDTNQSLMLRLRSHADSMDLVLKSITFAEHFLNYFSYVNSVLCKYMSVMSDNNCKLQTVLNEELKRNFTFDEYEDFVNCRSKLSPLNTLDPPYEFYNLELANNLSDQSQIQDFGFLTGLTNAQSSENLEYALGGGYDFVGSALENVERDQMREYYTQYLNNDLLTVQDVGYQSVANTNANCQVSTQDITISELDGYRGDELLLQNANPFVCFGQNNEATILPARSSQLLVNDVEDKIVKWYCGGEKGEEQKQEERYYGDRKEECYYGDRKEECYYGDRKEECYYGDRKEECYYGERKEECYYGERKEERYCYERKEECYYSGRKEERYYDEVKEQECDEGGEEQYCGEEGEEEKEGDEEGEQQQQQQNCDEGEEEQNHEEIEEKQEHEKGKEEQSSEVSDEQVIESGIQFEMNVSVNDFDTEALTTYSSSQEVGCSRTNKAKQENRKKSAATVREYTAEVTHAVSPSEIFVRFVEENCPLLQELFDVLEALKTDEKYKRPFFSLRQRSKKSNKFRLKKLGNYALYYSEADKTLSRVQFLDRGEDTADNVVSVLFLDTGIEERVAITNIYPMPEGMKKFPRFAFKCHLSDVFPKDSVNSVNWCSYDIEFMKKWISKNERVIFVLDEDAGDNDNSLPILLYDSDKVHCLNDEMRELQEIKREENEKLDKFVLENWDPMLDAHESNLNTYDLDADDPSCAVYGYVGKDYERLCKIYRKTGKCFKGVGCRKEHGVLHSSGYTTDQEEVFIDAFKSLPIPAVGKVLKVEVTHVTSGSQFHCKAFVKPGKRKETFASLVTYMNEKQNVLKMKRISIPPSIGQIVIAKCAADNLWYRAKVVDVIPENDEYTVFFVDYGNEERVPLSHLRMILPQFLHIPFQSMFCEIEGVVASPDRVEESMEYLDKVCSSVVKIKVVSVLPGFTPHLIVRLYNSEGKDVGEIMMEKKLVLSGERLVLNQNEMIPG